ncbi:hypothetical protein J6590_099788, partial [Homalodisca vitripennis]
CASIPCLKSSRITAEEPGRAVIASACWMEVHLGLVQVRSYEEVTRDKRLKVIRVAQEVSERTRIKDRPYLKS